MPETSMQPTLPPVIRVILLCNSCRTTLRWRMEELETLESTECPECPGPPPEFRLPPPPRPPFLTEGTFCSEAPLAELEDCVAIPGWEQTEKDFELPNKSYHLSVFDWKPWQFRRISRSMFRVSLKSTKTFLSDNKPVSLSRGLFLGFRIKKENDSTDAFV
ncbi:hypothetical protein V1478_012851 [Vespula squamosa]|uniref:Uncharacterized protein n=1 Tax=Vespula squamosa TaxID=30214 RepID=A0ABD2A983_VESSQ